MSAVPRTGAAAWFWGLSWGCWLVLLLQQGLDAFTRGAPWIIWVAYLVPLLIFLPGMLRDRLRSYVWLCFVSLLYFIRLVERLFAEPGAPAPIVGMVAVIGLFTCAMLYVRQRGPQLRRAEDSAPGDTDG
ncbi:DUF2069 domain-containing protein [Pseudohaliea rubra]|uniref:Transmembrane protein n=1 Tax=Pseudohaliea rubra DSM 19751 TaxID=1265313 RepID=A0A095XZT2_9GAMM|nr:DUF2069 domain-containing protein [Pseudohaliea rubra]KGE05291.1 hypothetical protein HRUBRA_00113 [Pseudohaliea rubra DSM 19751]